MAIYWEKIILILSTDKTWTVVSSVAAAFATIAALFTVCLATTSMKEERDSKRPYFILEKPGIKKLPNSPPFRMQITMINRGVHVASKFNGRILILNKNLAESPKLDIEFSVANAIPSNSPTPWYNDGVKLPQNIEPQFVVLIIKYNDPILEQKFCQTYFMQWDGIKDGATHPDFTYATNDDAIRLRKYLISQFDMTISDTDL